MRVRADRGVNRPPEVPCPAARALDSTTTEDTMIDPRELVPWEPITTATGSLCMLCDSTAGCSHPTTRCRRCGVVGLAENMTNHRCKERD